MKYLLIVALAVFCSVFFLVSPEAMAASGDKRVSLPKPPTTGGKPLLDAMALRHADRNISDRAVSEEALGNLLWAAWGVNRPDGRRTVPTAQNKQRMEVYAVLESGVWRYDAKDHALAQVMASDERSKFGGVPVTLLYAVPTDDPFGAMHAGSAYQNAGLFCASEGLANVVKATGKDALKGALPLPSGYAVVIIQCIGWPR